MHSPFNEVINYAVSDGKDPNHYFLFLLQSWVTRTVNLNISVCVINKATRNQILNEYVLDDALQESALVNKRDLVQVGSRTF